MPKWPLNLICFALSLWLFYGAKQSYARAMEVDYKTAIVKALLLSSVQLCVGAALFSWRAFDSLSRRFALWFALIVLALLYAIVGYSPALGGELSTAYHKVVLSLLLGGFVGFALLVVALYSLFRERKLLFLFLIVVLACFFAVRVPVVHRRVAYGLNGASLRNDGAVSASCRIDLGVPWIDLAPRRLLNFFTGSERCQLAAAATRFTLADDGSSIVLHCERGVDDDASLLLFPAYEFYRDRTSTLRADLIDAPNATLARMQPARAPKRVVRDVGGNGDGNVTFALADSDGEFFEAQCGQRPVALVVRHVVDRQRHRHLRAKRAKRDGDASQKRNDRFVAHHRRRHRADAERRSRVPPPLNLLILMLDGVSRAQFYRSLPRTAQLLAEWQRSSSSSIDVFEFFRYHSVAGSTRRGLMPMLMGRRATGSGGERRRRKMYERSPFVWHEPSLDGYATLFGVEQCVDYLHDYWGGSVQQPHQSDGAYRPLGIDHSLWQPFCHADYNGLSNFLGPYALKRRCIGETPVHRLTFDYVAQFWRNYGDVGRFGFVAMMEGHEGSLEVLRTVDDDLHTLLADTLHGALANDTALWLIGDHGNHMSPYFYFAHAGWQERSLPISTLLMPSRALDASKRSRLQVNQQRLHTQDDVHATIADLLSASIDGSKSSSKPSDTSRGRSLLGDKVLPERATCQSLSIPSGLCVCQSS
jgi:Protein of unknown function (DUF229)